MRFILIMVAFIVALSYQANAACRWVNDFKTGNTYQVCNYGSTTTTYGSNLRTGSTWSQTNNSDGSYYGRDSNNNYYTGNNNTGSYNNFGTGRSCYGLGSLRRCY